MFFILFIHSCLYMRVYFSAVSTLVSGPNTQNMLFEHWEDGALRRRALVAGAPLRSGVRTTRCSACSNQMFPVFGHHIPALRSTHCI